MASWVLRESGRPHPALLTNEGFAEQRHRSCVDYG